tara:strand:+ start:309 stop:533 length:225 start_codon:yes stop_codon:yes gene_type:complete
MTKEELEIASEHYAHNNFEMHETNSYKELKRGFEAGAKYTNQRVIDELENIAKEIYKAKEIGMPIANRIKELKQ